MSDIDHDRSRVRCWTSRDLAALTGASRPKILRTFVPGMLADGVLVKHGRSWYARRADIESWLLGQWTPPAAVPTRTRRR